MGQADQRTNIHQSELDRGWSPDFSWLADDLAVGGSFPAERAVELAHVHRIGAVIDLRGEDCDDPAKLQAAGIEFLHLPTPDLEPASVEMLDEGVAFARRHAERGARILIHCEHGIGRSALLALCVLVDRGLQPIDALRHAKDCRERVSPSRSQYEGWVRWLAAREASAPDYHEFGCIAYRHLAAG